SNIFTNAIESFSPDDQELPHITAQIPHITQILLLLETWIWPSNSLLKEVVEILFREELIKVLFATDIFYRAQYSCQNRDRISLYR
ncbi:hypothetical protein F5050DRAFT_1575093, partial [Lentinula boryana]